MALLALLLVFTLSGFSGLIFEVLWVRLASLAIGVTVQAVSTVVASFMGGLALGGYLASRWADARSWGVRVYAAMELGICLCGLLTTQWLRWLPHWSNGSWSTVLLASLAMLVPCTLMGATVPLLSRLVVHPSRIGRLYAANTLGAMLGALVADFYLVPQWGVWQAAMVAASLNCAAGAFAWFLRGRLEVAPISAPQSGQWLRIHFAYAMHGLLGLALQVIWMRLLGVAAQPRIWVFSLMLAIYLGLLALGSWFASFWVGREQHPLRTFGLLSLGIATSSLLGPLALVWLEPHLWHPPLSQWLWLLVRPFGPEMGWGMVLSGLRCLVLFGIPVFLMGMAFPSACAAALQHSSGIGQPVGRLYMVNTFGAILGSLLAGFVLLPWLGVQTSLLTLTGLGLLIAMVALAPKAWMAVAWTFWLGLAFLPRDLLVQHFHYAVYLRNYGVQPQEIVEFREDLYGTVAVAKGTEIGDVLMVNETMMMGSGAGGRRYARLMSHLPLCLHPRPKKMLVICFGLGMSFGAASRHSELESLRCVELSSAVLELGKHFASYNEHVLDRLNPNIQVTLADGRNFLLRSTERYDIITFEPPPPRNPGIVNLYSLDYYRLCREHLNPGGMICQWMPLAQLSDPIARRMIRAFVEVFPEASLWEGSIDDYLLVGSTLPVKVSKQRFAQLFREHSEQLADIGLFDPLDLLASFKQGSSALERYSSQVPPVSDNHPYLEYSQSVRPSVEELRISDISALEQVVQDLDDQDRRGIHSRVEALQSLQNYTRLSSAHGDEVTWLWQYRWARKALAQFPDNPYVEDVLAISPRRLQALRRRGLEELAFGQLLAGQRAELRISLARLQQITPERPLSYLLAGLEAHESAQFERRDQAWKAALERVKEPFRRTLERELGSFR